MAGPAGSSDRGDTYVTDVVKHFRFRLDERGTRRIPKTPGRTEAHPSSVLRADREAAFAGLVQDLRTGRAPESRTAITGSPGRRSGPEGTTP